MRSQLIDVQCHTSDRNLDFIRQLKARENAFQLHQKLNMLSAVSQTQSTIQLLLATSDFVGALDLISTTKEILRTELHGLHCLKHLDSQLHEMHKVHTGKLNHVWECQEAWQGSCYGVLIRNLLVNQQRPEKC